MGFNCGIVGLPNVGKSTLFNALTETEAAQSANYPFCTIDPNIGRVAIPDFRLDRLARLANAQKIIPSFMEFVDIAGLVKGASKGEGLGNQFLANIREVDAICHVLRCFEEADITHVNGTVDPLRDKEIIETELMLADMESLEKRLQNLRKKAIAKEKEAMALITVMEKALAVLHQGKPARQCDLTKDEVHIFQQMQLLTAKPVLYICNVDEETAASGNHWTNKIAEIATAEGAGHVIISAAIEAEVALLESVEEKSEFLLSLGLQETGLNRVIGAGFQLLDRVTFFTVGPKEARAWTVARGAKAPEAAGVIHTDFARGFICAETITFDDYMHCEGETMAREKGKMRLEGRDYQIQDGDVVHFRFNL